jgi:hypothetical protein
MRTDLTGSGKKRSGVRMVLVSEIQGVLVATSTGPQSRLANIDA